MAKEWTRVRILEGLLETISLKELLRPLRDFYPPSVFFLETWDYNLILCFNVRIFNFPVWLRFLSLTFNFDALIKQISTFLLANYEYCTLGFIGSYFFLTCVKTMLTINKTNGFLLYTVTLNHVRITTFSQLINS